MRKASYITLGISIFLFVLFLLLWLGGLILGQMFGGFLHLLLFASILSAGGFIVGIVLLILSFVKKPNNTP